MKYKGIIHGTCPGLIQQLSVLVPQVVECFSSTSWSHTTSHILCITKLILVESVECSLSMMKGHPKARKIPIKLGLARTPIRIYLTVLKK